MKKFVNFIEFVTDNVEAQVKNLYHPVKTLRKWDAQKGDFWRLLVHKSILRGVTIDFIEARILSCDTNCAGIWDGTFTDTTKKAVFRRQYCEKYTQFTIKINETSTESNYRQFALVRDNGSEVLGTVALTAETAEEYAVKIKDFFQSYSQTKVVVYRNGTLLTVRAYINENFSLRDEDVQIGIGQVAEQNTNAPNLSIVFVETVSYDAQNSWQIVIKNVEVGNIYELNGVKYEVVKGDTVTTVKKALIGEADRFIIEESDIVSIKTTLGARYVANTNRPSLQLSYFDVSGGNDRYIVNIGSSVRNGNTFQIQASGQLLKSVTANATDDAASIKAALVELSGYYEVPTGTLPEWSAIAGRERIENTFEPELYLTDLITLPAVNKDKYRIVIGSDVVKGNKFTLGDKEYIATSLDDDESVAKALGLTASADYIEVSEGVELNGLAVVGKKYTSEDITDVSIVEQPHVMTSDHAVLEIDFDVTADKTYVIQLYDTKHEKIIAFSNLLEVFNDVDETNVVEVADMIDTMGYQYYEPGLTQIMRLPVYLRTPLQQSQQNQSKLLNGGYRRSNTIIQESQDLITHAESVDFHATLAAWLKHANVWISDKPYFSNGEYAENIISELSQSKQAKTTLFYQGERNNKVVYFTTDSKPNTYGTIFLDGFHYGLKIIVKYGTFEAEMQQGNNVLPIAEYNIIIVNDGDARKIRIAPGGYELWAGVVPKRSLVRFARLVRVESGQTLEIRCEKVAALSVSYLTELQSQQAEVISYVDEQFESTDFNEDFGEDFNG